MKDAQYVESFRGLLERQSDEALLEAATALFVLYTWKRETGVLDGVEVLTSHKLWPVVRDALNDGRLDWVCNLVTGELDNPKGGMDA